MAEFKLKDWYNKEQTFDKETIYLPGADGSPLAFTQGAGKPVIEPLEATENGTYELPEGVDGFGPVTVNVPDPSKLLLREESEITGFALDESYGYGTAESPAPFALEVGRTYYVSWDGETYKVTAQDASGMIEGAVFMGNGSSLGLEGNGEPFIIGYAYDSIIYFAPDDPAASHTVGIWQDLTVPVIRPLEVTENGTYEVPEGVDGFGPVTVSVEGSSAELRYVTFLSEDGSTEYGRKAVALGDDCADPIARGIFDTPTKESDAQYTYTFYGWATTPNGAADENALKAVTEDRTVYANFASVVQQYTVSFYDGTTLLKTEQVAYGGSSSYVYEKAGYIFDGWSPEPVNVTADMDCYAVLIVDDGMIRDSWETIAAHSADGTASTVYKVGAYKNLDITNASGTVTTVKAVIAGFNLHKNANGVKEGITFIWNRRVESALSGGTNLNGHSNLDNVLYTMLPDDVKTVMKQTMFDYNYGTSDAEDISPTLTTATRYLFAPELFNLTSELSDTASYTITKFNMNFVVKLVKNQNDNALFPLFSGKTSAEISAFFSTEYAIGTRTYVYGTSGNGKMASSCSPRFTSSGVKLTDASSPAVCFRV